MASRSELANLAEGEVLDGVELTRAEAAALNATRLVTVQPTGDGWRVTAAHAVGALRSGDLVVRVRPKVGVLQVLRLVARAYGITGLNLDESIVQVAGDADLTAVLAVLFAQEAATALTAGPLRGYRSEDHSLNVLRGRLRLREQELRRFGQLVPLEVTFDEWTADTDENRRIRAATRRLLPLGLPTGVRDRLLHVDRLLADPAVQLTALGRGDEQRDDAIDREFVRALSCGAGRRFWRWRHGLRFRASGAVCGHRGAQTIQFALQRDVQFALLRSR